VSTIFVSLVSYRSKGVQSTETAALAHLDNPDIRRTFGIASKPAIAATLTSPLEPLRQSSGCLTEALPEQRQSILEARGRAESFVYGELVDIYSFANHCIAIPGLQAVALDVKQALEQAVPTMVINDVMYPEARGLSLYFPILDAHTPDAFLKLAFPITGELYRTQGLRFVEQSHWLQFLDSFFGN